MNSRGRNFSLEVELSSIVTSRILIEDPITSPVNPPDTKVNKLKFSKKL